MAKRLAKDGLVLALNYAGNAREADVVVTGIREAGGAAVAVQPISSTRAQLRPYSRHAKNACSLHASIKNPASCRQICRALP
jgi:hypothetical protein